MRFTKLSSNAFCETTPFDKRVIKKKLYSNIRRVHFDEN